MDKAEKERLKDQLAFTGHVGEREKCDHMSFVCRADIGRMSEVEGGPITGYTAEIQVKCAQCNLAFRFVGLPAGNHFAEPRVSLDGLELRAPLEPATHAKFVPTASYVLPPRDRQ